MNAKANPARPARGMILAFKPSASSELAHVPGRVTDIWPRFRSGEYLVTLEYERPVRFKRELIRHIDAFLSELYPPARESAVERAR